MSQSFNILVSKIILSSKPCNKLLEYDGIGSNRLVLREQTGKLMLNCKNVPALKEKISGLGISITIIKNLDEYQFLICKYIPNLSDQNVFKLKFQKIRLLIFLFVNRFTSALLETRDQISSKLIDLNKSGNGILKETSELIQVFRDTSSAKKFNIDNSKNLEDQINLQKDHFISFDHDESEVNKILFSIYGFNLKNEKKIENAHDNDENHDVDDDDDRVEGDDRIGYTNY
ncbi:hypothetical protein [Candidatus Nitrosocosmicus hydrocola]|uniref:hypothetical protein n=1 Tax=Candidatus Nitrosocosmicus hydrocola TaxID=1826872 RepID=UPI0011E5A797|nr:hypothetical protein [Candidatus Nitrosocosmicus hydrocola]